MARIRTVKPEYWQDEKLSPLAPLHRLVFLGLISMADDAGRVVDNVKSIDGFLFPSTDDTSCESLEILAKTSRILRYVAPSGQKIIQVVNWARHQQVAHPSKYTLPGPDLIDLKQVESSNGVAKKARTTLRRGSRVSPASINDLRSTTNDPHISPAMDAEPSPSFVLAWNAYPKRANNNRQKAWRCWKARLAEGEQEAVMLAGTRAYAAFVAHEGIEPRFVKLAATFFGPDKHYGNDYTLPAASAEDLEPEPEWIRHPEEHYAGH